MRLLKKILKWTGIILLVLLAAAAVTIAARQDLKYNAPYPNIKASPDTTVIAHGKHLVYGAAHCINCHNRLNADSLLNLGQEIPLIGGNEFDIPVGKIYSKNITPDPETGIGKYTDGEIARALRYGVRPDGTAMLDFMPFHNTSDEDLTAIISFLRSQKPVKNKTPENSYNLLGKAVKAFLLKPVGPDGNVLTTTTIDSTANYGGYLTSGVANCRGCHTMRDMMTGGFTGVDYSGGMEVEGMVAPNLTPDSSGRIFYWTKEQFIERFRKGKIVNQSPMPWNSFKRMSDEELTAIYHYLNSLKPSKTGALLDNRQ